MFAGGVAKLRNGGIAWLSGRSLNFYIRESLEYARWPALARFLVRRPGACRALALLTVVIELSSPLAIWDVSFLPPLVLLWSALHVGILLVMMPAYWVQMWCYVMVLDVDRAAALVTGRQLSKAPALPATTGSTTGDAALFLLGGAVAVTLLIVLTIRSEAWPLTSVPMYSNSELPGRERRPSLEELPTRARRALAGDVAAWKRPWMSAEAWEDVHVVSAEGARTPLFGLMEALPGATFARWSQYAKVLRSVVLADLAAKSAAAVAPDAAAGEFPASCFLRELAHAVNRQLPNANEYDRLEAVCLSDQGWVVIGRAALRASSRVRHLASGRCACPPHGCGKG
jgi:hypothetical protein